MNGEKTERELQLEREPEENRRRQPEVETTVSEKQRDIQELKFVGSDVARRIGNDCPHGPG